MVSMVLTILAIDSTVVLVAAWISPILLLISPVALAVWSASCLTSAATTAKPLPASPARAASMVALSARRLVWAAMLEMSSTTSPICCADSDSDWTFWLLAADSVAASLAMREE